jgi:D-beta-D-heptose 7-phosphate kinase/D-beta-D-heptose 1-phosphate adenosyltransferase
MNPLPRKRVEEILAKAKGKKILVIGDAMLDRSIYTTTTRNSPELADVPVLDILETKQYLGGADNVACNVFDLGCQADILTVIPSDHVHPLVRDGIKRHEAKCKTCTYTVKERVLVDGVQKFRLDTGNMRDAKNQEGNLIDSIRILVPQVDAVIVSDYNKGVITQAVFDAIVEMQSKSRYFWFSVNAKPENNVRVHHCSLLVLNRKEAAAYAPSKTNPTDFSPELIKQKMEKDKIQTVLVTLGADGMILFRMYEADQRMCAFGDCANDVCGAGDTVVAAATIAAQGGSVGNEMITFASMCAGIAVSKEGTATVTPEEVLEMTKETISKDGFGTSLIPAPFLGSGSYAGWKPVTVLATGCYDLPHVGHIDLLNQARKLGDRLVVGINCDKRVRELKGEGKPIISQEDRAFALLNLKCVNEVVIFDEDTSAECIRRVKPDIYVKGADYRVDEIPLSERQACEELGIEIKFINNVEKVGYKSSRVIDAVAAFLGVNKAPTVAQKPKNKAVFLDRDGTIIVDWIDQHEPEKVRMFPSAGYALKQLQNAGYLIFIVTNQSGINRGVFTYEQANAVNAKLCEMLHRKGVFIQRIYIAPERDCEKSIGRKPSPHFLNEAARDFDIDLSKSYFIGDKISDLTCGWNAFVKKSYLVMTGFGTYTLEKLKNNQVETAGNYHVSLDLLEAANHILEDK